MRKALHGLAASTATRCARRWRPRSRTTAATSSCVACAQLAREFGVGLHTHVPESKVQVIVGLKRYGKTLTAHLEDLGLLGPDFTVAHGVWLDDDDMKRPGRPRRLGGAQPRQQHAPRQRHRRHAPHARARLNVGIGTDGANCSDNLNMYESMRLASLVSKVQGPDTGSAGSPPRRCWRPPPSGSARALGFGDARPPRAGLQGRHRVPRPDHINWIPLNDPTNQLVHTEDGSGGAFRDGRRADGGREPPAAERRSRQACARRRECARAARGASTARTSSSTSASSRSSAASARASPRRLTTSTASAAFP